MAESKIVANLDRKLIDDGFLDPVFRDDYQIVHSMLNEKMRQTGKILTEETFQKGEEALREWLITLSRQGASQEKLTSYLRCGLAHLCFDYIESTYESILTDDLITRAMQSFKLRDYHKTYFKGSGASRKIAAKTPLKKSVKKTVKKAAVKKTPSKKAAVKKTVKKGAVKKTAVKKPVKKTAVKKKPVKTTIKKAAVKKKSVPKKKASVKKSSVKAVQPKAAVKKTTAKKAAKKTVKTEKKDTGSFISRLFKK